MSAEPELITKFDPASELVASADDSEVEPADDRLVKLQGLPFNVSVLAEAELGDSQGLL